MTATEPEPAILRGRESRKEDFPIPTFSHAERRISAFRSALLAQAAAVANRETPESEASYTVTAAHVDQAIEELLNDTDIIKRLRPDESAEI